MREAELAGLPDAARRYLRFAGVVGRPADWSFQLHCRGRFRFRQGWPWMPCEAWQYNSRPGVARVFHMRIDAAGLLPMLGRDSYLSGRGRMHGRLLGLVTVADGSGPEYDASELVTFLNDAAIWHLPDGPFTYAEFTFSPGDISCNVAPAALQTGMTRCRES